jgi:catechol 2,3-dioxygenase-like lactoylglutathione lyase family enzyme
VPLPLPVLDHVVINVRDRLDDALALWERLGFMMTPRGHHTLGSSNHLAIFGADYLELLGVQPGNARMDVLDWPAGLNGLAFKTYDADATYDGLHAAGLPALPAQAFSRPIEAPGGSQDAAFRTVGIERDAAPAGRVFFCQHLTPGLVWNGAWQRHSNRALGILRVIIAADDPAGPASLLSRMFGWNAVPPRDYGASMAAGLAQVDILTPDALRAEFGGAAPAADGRTAWMAALTLRTASLDAAATALATGKVPRARGPAGIVVPASELGGVTLVFQD